LDNTNEDSVIVDNGGTRTGEDRRQNKNPSSDEERRAGKDRRRGFDRRSGLARRRSQDRRNKSNQWDASGIERRDVFRKKDPDQIYF
jgi:hypothetical protein